MTPPVIGLLLALYNANTTTDWVTVASAAKRVPIRAIVPVPHVSPPDPGWAPQYPSPDDYRTGVDMLKAAGVEVYAYTHLRNLSQPCCTCCGNLTQYKGWVDTIKTTADFDGIMMDNNDAPWSAPNEKNSGLGAMYQPAANYISQSGLGVWANGPHVSSNGSDIRANASEWQKYLKYSNFTTLFEMGVEDWTQDADKPLNYSHRLGWPTSKLGGYVLNIPDDPHQAKTAIQTSLQLAVKRGLSWLYPTIKCQHRTGSCTYANLPSYWNTMIDVVEEMNRNGGQVVPPSPFSPPSPPRLPTWKSDRPDPTLPFGGYPLLNTTPELIFSATTMDGTYNHNVFIHYLPESDRLFAYWKNGVKEEDTPGQRILLSWREGTQWSTPVVAFGNLTTPGRATVMFGAPATTLPNGHTYIAASPAFYNESLLPHPHAAQGAQCALWPDSMNPRNCGPAASYAVLYHSTLLLRRVYANATLGAMFWLEGPPALFAAATQVFNIPSTIDMDEQTRLDMATLMSYSDDASRDVSKDVSTASTASTASTTTETINKEPCGQFTGTTKCEWCRGGCQKYDTIHYSLGISNERSTLTTADGIDVILYRAGHGSPLFASTRINQTTWSEPLPTNLPNDASNLNAGSLSNGLKYLVHNPVPRSSNGDDTTNNGRDPLTLTTSADGGWSWNNTNVIATCQTLPLGNCTPRFIHDVDHGPSYPQLIEIVQKNSNYEGTWVAFTNNKEDVFVVKVEL